MDITSVATSTSSMEHNEHEKNGTGDDDSNDTAPEQYSLQPYQLQQLYNLRWDGARKTWNSSHDRACYSDIRHTPC